MYDSQEDEDGNIFVGTSNSQLYLIKSTTIASPTLSPTTIVPSLSPVVGVAPTSSPISVGVACPLSYQNTEVLSSNPIIELDYSVVLEDAPHNGIFCARLRYASLGWVGVGRSDSGMVGSEPTIYKPEDGSGSVLKYSISNRNEAGIIPMAQQTLLSSSFSQTATTTTMEYVKLLKEYGSPELEIVNGVNSFVYGVGSSNTFRYHFARGGVTLNLALVPTSSPTMKPTNSPTKAPSNAPTDGPTATPPSPRPTAGSPSTTPTNDPTRNPTNAPSKSPTLKPTGSPTIKPTPFVCKGASVGCLDDNECCSFDCDNTGKPSQRTYTCRSGGGGSPTTAAPTKQPTPNVGCKALAEDCVENSECCSGKCDNKGKQSNRTYKCVSGNGKLK
mmetsp:Transcript_42306/g.88844  ORF Transcript_42306/g.88844 Transcript_42306/m.88844 type:complete len:387 (+) Transcript_42306:697-1857(+)